MFTSHELKPTIHHIHRGANHILSIEKMFAEKKSLYFIETQFHAVSKSVSSCHNNTFKELISGKLSREIHYRLRTSGIQQNEFQYYRTASRNVSNMSLDEILSYLDWLEQAKTTP